MKPRTAEELAAWEAQENAINDYANAMIQRDKIQGHQGRFQDERSPDGRLVYPEMAGLMKNPREYNR